MEDFVGVTLDLLWIIGGQMVPWIVFLITDPSFKSWMTAQSLSLCQMLLRYELIGYRGKCIPVYIAYMYVYIHTSHIYEVKYVMLFCSLAWNTM